MNLCDVRAYATCERMRRDALRRVESVYQGMASPSGKSGSTHMLTARASTLTCARLLPVYPLAAEQVVRVQ